MEIELFEGAREKREFLEIIAGILLAANETKKWRIIYRANLNGQMFEKYIKMLTKTGLIEEDEERHLFVTTDAGVKFLENFSHLMEIMGLTG